jgi:transcriptional regulator with XRE-family HTH domain
MSRRRQPKWTPARIKGLRDRYGESQPRFARRIGCSPQLLRHYEQGRHDLSKGPSGLVVAALDRLEHDIDTGNVQPHPDDIGSKLLASAR